MGFNLQKTLEIARRYGLRITTGAAPTLQCTCTTSHQPGGGFYTIRNPRCAKHGSELVWDPVANAQAALHHYHRKHMAWDVWPGDYAAYFVAPYPNDWPGWRCEGMGV